MFDQDRFLAGVTLRSLTIIGISIRWHGHDKAASDTFLDKVLTPQE